MKKVILLALAVVLCSAAGNARKVKPFYGSKADIIGISGDADKLIQGEFENKFFKNSVDLGEIVIPQNEKGVINGDTVAVQLNANRAGLAILKYILDDGNGNISFERLDQRSLQNVSQSEEEVAAADENISKADLLKANVAPQFSKNYIYYERDNNSKVGKNSWVVLRVDMDESTFEQVWNIVLENGGAEGKAVSLDKLDVINPQVVLVKTGTSKKDDYEMKGYALRTLAKEVPDFAIRGQVARKYSKVFPNALTTAVGTNNGLENNDLVYVYRAKTQNIDGEVKNVSNKIGAARVVKISDNESMLYGLSGGWASEKRGDVAVLHKDKKQSSNLMFNYQNKSIGFDYQHEFLLNMNKAGISQYILARIGVSFLLPSESKLKDKAGYNNDPSAPGASQDPTDYGCVKTTYVPANAYYWTDSDDNLYMRYFDNFKKPIFFHLGVGYGVSFRFAHMIELMPYVMAEAEMLYGSNINDTFSTSTSTTTSDLPKYMAVSIRGKAGAKCNINLDKSNRFQWFAGFEVNFCNIGINSYSPDTNSTSNKDFELKPYKWWDEGIAKVNHVRRNGLALFTGFKINF